MKKIISLILFSSLLVGCSSAEPTSSEVQQEVASSKTTDSGFEFTHGVDISNISYADEENYINIEGISHTGKNIYVIYDLTVVDKIQPDEDGTFKYHSKSNDEKTRLVFSDDQSLTFGDSDIYVSDLENTKTINVYPNENYLAALEKENTETESIVAEKQPEETDTQLESESAVAEEKDDAVSNSTESIKNSEEQELPREHENALNSAYDYLNYTSFSKQGLYDQLIFEGFPGVAAQYAVDNVSTDWRENALKSAQDYLDYTSFSKQGLYEQLLFEGHPESDAQYAIDNVSADWNQNALETAKNYLDFTSFSDQGLYEQLLFEGYTNSQAQYAIDNLP